MSYKYKVTIDEFLEWAKKKDPTTPTNLRDNCNCPMAKYGMEAFNWPHASAGVWTVDNRSSERALDSTEAALFIGFGYDDFDDASTYGDLVEKLEARKKQMFQSYR